MKKILRDSFGYSNFIIGDKMELSENEIIPVSSKITKRRSLNYYFGLEDNNSNVRFLGSLRRKDSKGNILKRNPVKFFEDNQGKVYSIYIDYSKAVQFENINSFSDILDRIIDNENELLILDEKINKIWQ